MENNQTKDILFLSLMSIKVQWTNFQKINTSESNMIHRMFVDWLLESKQQRKVVDIWFCLKRDIIGKLKFGWIDHESNVSRQENGIDLRWRAAGNQNQQSTNIRCEEQLVGRQKIKQKWAETLKPRYKLIFKEI